MAFPLGWPPRASSGLRAFRFFASGTTTANFSDNAFLFHQVNQAVALIGGVDINGTVLISTTSTGQAANTASVQVVVPAGTGAPQALSATVTPAGSLNLTVSLAVLADGELNDAANTATLVTAAVAGVAGFGALANGTGATALRKAEQRRNFFGAGSMFQPMPVVPPGGVSSGTSVLVNARVGSLQAGGAPMGSGVATISPSMPTQDPYGPPEPMVWSASILIMNDDGTATNTLEYTFDGINIHGRVRGGETVTLRFKAEAGIAVRRGAGTPAFRIHAW